MKIETLLIANRGEIACRIMRSAQRMGVRCVAVHSDADARSRHVRVADEAHGIGPAPAAESYLVIEKLIEVARSSGAQAIHPGYGFLAENAAFAEACEAAGILFVGPSPMAIRSMSEKHIAKAIMREAGVPVIPGEDDLDQRDEVLAEAADRVGYPLLIKAVSGGGGRGMRTVAEAVDFEAALASARREAQASFGDDRMLLERLVSPSRHIEVQVFADAQGNVVHLFERDCSIQRRHQKLVEEAPAPGLDPTLRRALGETAVRATRAIGYRGAGTVEFLLDLSGGEDEPPFYFMEMNTRLQVEHPVTEMVTGVDLVEWQLRVASGETLPRSQEELAIDGHSIEVRICAEDCERGFLPAAGRIVHLGEPPPGRDLRFESGVETGDEVSPWYDSMLAKLVVWGQDRPSALANLRSALAELRIAGLPTNRDFLVRIARHPLFAAGGVDGRFLDEYSEQLLPSPSALPDSILCAAAIETLLARDACAAMLAERGSDPSSPWHATDGWRLNHVTKEALVFRHRDEERRVEVMSHGVGATRLELESGEVEATGRTRNFERLSATGVDIHRFEVQTGSGEGAANLHLSAVDDRERIFLFSDETTTLLTRPDLQSIGAEEDDSAGSVLTPMPGKVLQVFVAQGDEVERGQALVVVEAMKMEHTVRAGLSAKVTSLEVAEGDQVEDGAVLLTLEEH